jgi:hypothetical protein
VQKRPLVIEKERINFEFDFGEPLSNTDAVSVAELER